MNTEQKTPKGEIPPELRWNPPTKDVEGGYYLVPYEAIESICGKAPEEEADCINTLVEKYKLRRLDALKLCKKAAKMALETPVCFICNTWSLDQKSVYLVIDEGADIVWGIYRRPYDGWVRVTRLRRDGVVAFIDTLDVLFRGELPYFRLVRIWVKNFKVRDWDIDVVWV